MNKKICTVVVMLLMCTSALLILPEEPNARAISGRKIIFYFDSYDPTEAWETHYSWGGASTTIDGDVELLNGNTCEFCNSGTITKVELQVTAKYVDNQRDTILQPVFGGSSDGEEHPYDTTRRLQDSPWFDITDDENGPGAESWDWSDVEDLDCKVKAENNPSGGEFTLYYAIVRIRVTYE